MTSGRVLLRRLESVDKMVSLFERISGLMDCDAAVWMKSARNRVSTFPQDGRSSDSWHHRGSTISPNAVRLAVAR